MTQIPTASYRPTRVDLKMYRGDDYKIPLAFDDGATPPATIDVSTWNFSAQVRNRPNDEEVLLSFTVDMTSAVSGTIVLTADKSLTATLPAGPLHWDVQRALPSQRTLVAGQFLVQADVTR